MLEARAHQHARFVLEDVDSAVSVVHIEVHHRDALQAARQRLVHTHRDVVVEAEAHRLRVLGVMTRWTHRAERVGELAREHRLHGRDHAAGGARRGIERVDVQRRVGIGPRQALGRVQLVERSQVMLRDAPSANASRSTCRRLVTHSSSDNSPEAVQVIEDRRHPRRRLRMPFAHVVARAESSWV
jgi:hypothetical protein